MGAILSKTNKPCAASLAFVVLDLKLFPNIFQKNYSRHWFTMFCDRLKNFCFSFHVVYQRFTFNKQY